ncbi:MAG: hypothetical protein KAR06_04950 [Deltaproteobacteria bacterium]|nr:hypothetical protein [Deltaproteobacteria bacterium]
MKLTNGEIFNAEEPLRSLLSEKLPVKTAFALAKLARKLDEYLIPIKETRLGLFKTYGEIDTAQGKYIVRPYIDDGKGNAIENPKAVKLRAETEELMAIEIEVVVDVVELPETLEVKPATLMALEKFVR